MSATSMTMMFMASSLMAEEFCVEHDEEYDDDG
jgi:hypothetical protein